MSDNIQVHYSADNEDLACPVCFSALGQEEHQPITTNCGHTVCSTCFGKIAKCPLCKVVIDKKKKYQKSVLLSSLIANSTKAQICKEHSNVCQGICRQDKVFVCLDCVLKGHQGHQILTMKDLNEKTKKMAATTQKVQEKKKVQLEIKKSIEANNINQKRKIDEKLDQEIFQLSMLKKKLYKEIDIQTISDKDHNEHKLLSENLSKYCKNAEKMLEGWNNNQEADLAIQIMDNLAPETQKFEDEINVFKTSIKENNEKFTNDFTQIMSYFSAKINEVFPHNRQNNTTLDFSQLELEYLIDILRQYSFIVSCNNNVLELKDDGTEIPSFKLDFSYLTCSLSKISLNFPNGLPQLKFQIIYKILENIRGLKDLTLQKFHISNTVNLPDWLSNLKSLERFHIEVDLNGPCQPTVGNFMKGLISVKNLFNIDIQYREPQTIISFQRIPSQKLAKPMETLQEVSLNAAGCPIVVCETLHTLNSCQSLKVLRLSFGKTNFDSQVLEAVHKTLQPRTDLEELTLTCEELNSLTEIDLSVLLRGLTQKKKLCLIVNRVLLAESPTKFLKGCYLQELEEFTLKIKCGTERNAFRAERSSGGIVWNSQEDLNVFFFAILAGLNGHNNPPEDFNRLIKFLANSKRLKKLCLQFDGIYLTADRGEKLLDQITKLKTLVSLEIEFLNLVSFNPNAERDLEAILGKLPPHVKKKYTFSRPNPQL